MTDAIWLDRYVIRLPQSRLDGLHVYIDPTTNKSYFSRRMYGKCFLKGRTATVSDRLEVTPDNYINPSDVYFANTLNGVRRVYPISTDTFIKYLSIDAPTELAEMATLGIDNFLMLKTGFRPTPIERISEKSLQTAIVDLVALTKLSFKFEFHVPYSASFRRFDFVEIYKDNVHVFELKKGCLTLDMVKEKIETSNYIDAILKHWSDKKTIELTFVSPDGIYPDANSYLENMVDADGFILPNYLRSIVGSNIFESRRIKINYVGLADLFQTTINSVYADVYSAGGYHALKIFINDNKKMLAQFPNPTVKY